MEPVHVVWMSLHEPEISHAGYWDQGMLRAAMDATLWRPVGLPEFAHHERVDELPAGVGGCVLVVPARWHVDDVEAINRQIARLGWVFVILTGDEESVFPWQQLHHHRMEVWVQTPRPDRHHSIGRGMGDGWPPAAPAILRECRDDAARREVAWSFAGQINNPDREDAYTALRARQDRRGDGVLRPTRAFGSGMPYEEYLHLLAATRVAPCPSGTFSPDSFRVFEALDAGCVPILPEQAPRTPSDGYWPFLLGDHPMPVLRGWGNVDEVIDAELDAWPANANRVFSWWQQEKRRFAYDFVDTVARLAGRVETSEEPDEKITVLMPTSPIPSHPSMAIIEKTLASVRKRLPTAEVIVMVDGVRAEQEHRRADYEEYVRCLLWRANHEWPNVLPVVYDEHLHQAEMTRRTLGMVRTPAILFVEHDTPLFNETPPWLHLLAALKDGNYGVIRLHHEASILEPHRHLMLDEAPQQVQGCPLMRTVQWSQRPHLADADLYRGFMDDYFGVEARTMIEDVMHGVVQTAWHEQNLRGWRRFRLAIYTPPGDIKRSTHLDGRAGDDKYEMVWRYDTDKVPMGAPSPNRDEVIPARAPRHPFGTVVERGRLRLGVFGARGDRRGLASQTTEVARHLHPVAVFGINMHELSPYKPDWTDYDPETLTVAGPSYALTEAQVHDWIIDNGINVIWGAETFYVEWFTRVAAETGARTILAPNPEFFSHVAAEEWAPMPDVLAAATRWRMSEMPGAIYLPHPVDRERLPFKHRERAETFLFVMGHQAARDRQGFGVLCEAMGYITEPVHIVIRTMTPLGIPEGIPSNVTVDVRTGVVENYWEVYEDGDVFIHPRRYGGLSLPMQEALSRGMVVLTTDTSPQNGWLPPGMLLPTFVERVFKNRAGEMPLQDADPRALAARIDELVRDPEQVRKLSSAADALAEAISWEKMEPEWLAVLDSLAR